MRAQGLNVERPRCTVIRRIDQIHPAVVVVLGNWTNWSLHGELIRRHVQYNGDTPKERIEHAQLSALPRQAARP
jgi:hypothetical protein